MLHQVKPGYNKRMFVSLAVLFFITAFIGSSFAQPGPGGRDKRRAMVHEKLNLSNEQETKIETLRTEHQKQMIDLRAGLDKAKIELRELKRSDKISRSEVNSAVEKMNKIRNEISLAAANHRMDVYEILTPEQREIWHDYAPRFERKGDFQHRKNLWKERGRRDFDW